VRFRYSRWDGTQDPFGPDVSTGELLDEISDELLGGAGAEDAIRRLQRRGVPGRFSGLDALRSRLRRARRREQERLNLSGPLDEIRERLEAVLERERATLSFSAEDDARIRETAVSASSRAIGSPTPTPSASSTS
jgi:uncharacterized protein with von Willebrand factor type A (vWA) domain